MRRTGAAAFALPATALAIGLLIVVACGRVGSAPASAPPATDAAQSPAISAAQTSPASTAPATKTPTSVAPTTGSVPVGLLAHSDSPALAGWQGSYCWKNVCADMAGPPAMEDLPALEADATDTLGFSVDPPEGSFVSWTATYTGSDGKSHELAGGGSDADPDSTASAPPSLLDATFEGPPAGDWTLTMFIRFAAGGDAMYAWHVTVE